jgi:hypothetical protein
LTPYRGGWCGNEVFAARESTALSPEIRRQAQRATVAIGAHLKQAGYWGYFGLDFLLDQDTGALYLGELNPRVTGATPLTSQAALDQDEVPLLLFHLLEWLGVEYVVDVAQFNQRWVKAEQITSWSQMILEHTAETIDMVTQAPPSGIWHMAEDGTVQFARPAFHPQVLTNEAEVFFLRTIDAGHTPGKGDCIGRLMTRGRLMTDDYQLTERARAWSRGLRAQFATLATDNRQRRSLSLVMAHERL